MPERTTPSSEIDRTHEPPNLRRRFVAWLQRQGPGGHYSENHFRPSRTVELMVVALLVLLFVGGYLGFIAWLAATR